MNGSIEMTWMQICFPENGLYSISAKRISRLIFQEDTRGKRRKNKFSAANLKTFFYKTNFIQPKKLISISETIKYL